MWKSPKDLEGLFGRVLSFDFACAKELTQISSIQFYSVAHCDTPEGNHRVYLSVQPARHRSDVPVLQARDKFKNARGFRAPGNSEKAGDEGVRYKR